MDSTAGGRRGTAEFGESNKLDCVYLDFLVDYSRFNLEKTLLFFNSLDVRG